MKIEVKIAGTKEYYDEVLYVVSRYKKILKNPREKVYELTKYLTCYSFIVLLVILFLIIIYYLHKDILSMFLIGMMVLLLIYSLMSLVRINKKIRLFMSKEEDKTININENGIEYISEEKNLKVKWSDIAYVIANKYSICFIPKQSTDIIISLSVYYKQEVIDGLRKYERGILFIDNN